jgi:hypothetical protein
MRQKIIDSYEGRLLTIFVDRGETFIHWHNLSCQLSGIRKDSGLLRHINNVIHNHAIKKDKL